MKVFRLCDNYEIETLANFKNPKLLGKTCKIDHKKNTHLYKESVKYMHFFPDEFALLYLSPDKGKHVCVYDIPDEILEKHKGTGNYADFINFEKIHKVTEYAIPSDQIKLDYLKQIYLITEDIDFDFMPQKEYIYDCLTCMVDLTKPKQAKEISHDDEER